MELKKTYKSALCVILSALCLSSCIQKKIDENKVNQVSEQTEELSNILKSSAESSSTGLTEYVPEIKKTIEYDVIFIPYKYEGKYGLLDKNGKNLFPAEYDLIKSLPEYKIAFGRKNSTSSDPSERWILKDNGTRIPMEELTDEIKEFPNFNFIKGNKFFLSGQANNRKEISLIYSTDLDLVSKIEGFIISDTMLIQSPEFLDSTNAFNHDYPRKNYISINGEIKTPGNTFMRLYSFDEENNVGTVFDENFDGRIIDGNGNFVTEKKWFNIRTFSDGLVFGSSELHEQGFFSPDGELKIPFKEDIQDSLPMFHSKRFPCIFDGYNFILMYEHKENNNWAIINTAGKIVQKNISAKYIGEYSSYGFAIAELGDENHTLIDTEGNLLNLGEFTSIDPSCINGFYFAKKNNEDYLISTWDKKLYKCNFFGIEDL